ncbi:MAG: hypothetical protein L6R39_007475 [Caloplaca ligustica]|nr:MAG: hypothetical protein L6R39_007475 [Caloplaca ligustica]
MIYRFLLPSQDVPIRSHLWANMIDVPNDSIGILRVNKQIHDEARKLLYSSTTFTIAVRPLQFQFLRFQECWKEDLLPFMGLVRGPKHWQLSLRLSRYPTACPELSTKDMVLALSNELVKTSDLQTLKISFPCLCGVAVSADTIGATHLHISRILEPLWQLRVRGEVTFVAARGWHPWKDELAAYLAENPEPPQSDQTAWSEWRQRQPRWWHPREDEELSWAVRSVMNTQCPEPACLGLAESFNDIRYILVGTTIPAGFTRRQTKWLELKKTASGLIPGGSRGIDWMLGVHAMSWASDAEFDRIVEYADKILRKQHEILSKTGRLEHFFAFDKDGTPYGQWERRFRSMTGRGFEYVRELSVGCGWYWYGLYLRPGDELYCEVKTLGELRWELERIFHTEPNKATKE